MPDETDPTETAEQRTKRLGALLRRPPLPVPPLAPPTTEYQDSVPDLNGSSVKQSDDFLNQLLCDVYGVLEKLTTKPLPPRTNKTEFQFSCPFPGHPDKHPSTSINLKTGRWDCYTCAQGGDLYDLYCLYRGMPWKSYQANMYPFKLEMAKELGFAVVKGISGGNYFVPPEPVDAPIEATAFVRNEEPPVYTDPDTTITSIRAALDPTTNYKKMLAQDLAVDWESIFPDDSYIRRHMEITSVLDLPHEYHLFMAFQALAAGVGNRVYLQDETHVKPNLFVCLYGTTGIGKTRAIKPLVDVLQQALPYIEDDTHEFPSTGVLVEGMPNSAESLVDMLHYELRDPSTNKVTGLAPINCVAKIEELSGLIAKASRPGSAIREIIIEGFDVGYGKDLTTRSRGHGIVRARSPFLQLTTTTQPQAVSDFLKRADENSGFLNRWMMPSGVPRRAPKSYGAVVIDMKPAADLLRVLNSYHYEPYLLTGEPFEVWDNRFERDLAKYKSGAVEVNPMATRVDLFIKKLICLCTVNAQEPQPTVQTVEQATALLPYLLATASRFSSAITDNPTRQCEEWVKMQIEAYQKKYSKNPTLRDLVTRMNNKWDRYLFRRAMENLVGTGELMEQPGVGRGHNTFRYGIADPS